ncbi:MAG: TetR/AcrR family transcriptional regulator [Pseudomonadota bacterium]|nr:TetR/AcrR family transcriptional regulator [Pseudomonadota bacterium]
MLQQRSKDTKETIRLNALRLFAKSGYSAVSMRDIANAVGIQPGAIYNHFPSKQDILVDLMMTHMVDLLAAANNAMEGVEGTRNRLVAFARFHISYQLDFPDHVFIAYMELRSLEETGRQDVYVKRDEYEAILREVLEQGVKEGTFEVANAAVQTRALLAMMTGITVWFREDGELNRDQVIDCYVQAVLQSVGIQE